MRTKERIIQMVEEFVTYDAEVTRDCRIMDDLRIDYGGMMELKDGINSEYDIDMTLEEMFGCEWEESTVGDLIDNVLKRLGRYR